MQITECFEWREYLRQEEHIAVKKSLQFEAKTAEAHKVLLLFLLMMT